MFKFEVINRSGEARLGRLVTPHGDVDTPVFMPVGTAGSVKGVTPEQLHATGTRMILANTYHLLLRPGAEAVAQLGGLHALMAWSGPILTDSGGYQVFSLAHMRKIDDQAATFKSHIDGSDVTLTPRRAIEVQKLLGADIIMQLDECPPADADKAHVAAAVRRSADWARLCKQAWLENGSAKCGVRSAEQQPAGAVGRSSTPNSELRTPNWLFGIQQGGMHIDLRRQSAEAIVELDLPGYAIGGLSVGEGHQAMVDVLSATADLLPADRPRYLMGVGEPRDILAAVQCGVDMFDCVLPTRNGRNAQAFTWRGRLRLRNRRHALDRRPLDETCDCYACRNFSRGAIRHLFMAREMLGPTLLTIHNLHFFAQFMGAIRRAIAQGDLPQRSAQWLEQVYFRSEEDNHELPE